MKSANGQSSKAVSGISSTVSTRAQLLEELVSKVNRSQKSTAESDQSLSEIKVHTSEADLSREHTATHLPNNQVSLSIHLSVPLSPVANRPIYLSDTLPAFIICFVQTMVQFSA